ncbi:hypothetical protein EXE46_16180 [Halorubrum sp. GN11_10-6_MGM]|nr:hypothetical protein EXE46_16180 [Halorubrum sp. GN11_10-6_MGM]
MYPMTPTRLSKRRSSRQSSLGCSQTRKAQQVSSSRPRSCHILSNLSVNRSNGWLAQPLPFLFNKETGAFAPQEQVTWLC